MTDVKPRVVAVIPCYNTESHIAEVVTKCLPHLMSLFNNIPEYSLIPIKHSVSFGKEEYHENY